MPSRRDHVAPAVDDLAGGDAWRTVFAVASVDPAVTDPGGLRAVARRRHGWRPPRLPL